MLDESVPVLVVVLLSLLLLALAVGVVGGAVWAVATWLGRRRWPRDVQEVATRLGLLPAPASTPTGAGPGRRDVVSGEVDGRRVELVHRQPSSRRSDRFEVVVALPARMPTLLLERSFPTSGGLRRLLRRADRDLESASFNDVWIVDGASPPYVNEILSPRVMHHLLDPVFTGAAVQIVGDRLTCFWLEGLPRPQDTVTVVRLLGEIIDLIPRSTWLKIGADPLRGFQRVAPQSTPQWRGANA